MIFNCDFDALENACRPLVMAHLGVRDVCPRCRRELSPRVIDSWRAGRRIHCTRCGWCGSWRSGTVLSKSVLSCSQFYVLMGLFRAGACDNRKVGEFIGVSHETIRNWRKWYNQEASHE